MLDDTKTHVEGRYLKAFIAVYEAFQRFPTLRHIPKALEHYRFEFGEEDELYHIKVISQSKSHKVGYDYAGDFWVRKKDYQYVARLRSK